MLFNPIEEMFLHAISGGLFGIFLATAWGNLYLYPRWFQKLPRWAQLCLGTLIIHVLAICLALALA